MRLKPWRSLNLQLKSQAIRTKTIHSTSNTMRLATTMSLQSRALKTSSASSTWTFTTTTGRSTIAWRDATSRWRLSALTTLIQSMRSQACWGLSSTTTRCRLGNVGSLPQTDTSVHKWRHGRQGVGHLLSCRSDTFTTWATSFPSATSYSSVMLPRRNAGAMRLTSGTSTELPSGSSKAKCSLRSKTQTKSRH